LLETLAYTVLGCYQVASRHAHARGQPRLLIDTGVLALDGKVIDADVRLGAASRMYATSVVGGPTEKGYCLFLSSLPP